jgi:hypothetical protein
LLLWYKMHIFWCFVAGFLFWIISIGFGLCGVRSGRLPRDCLSLRPWNYMSRLFPLEAGRTQRDR